jgi:hypothetical protein
VVGSIESVGPHLIDIDFFHLGITEYRTLFSRWDSLICYKKFS